MFIEILKNADLSSTTSKSVLKKLEKKLDCDLSDKKKLVDKIVMDYVDKESDEDEESEKEEKEDDDDDKEEEEMSTVGLVFGYSLVSIVFQVFCILIQICLHKIWLTGYHY